MIKKSITYRDLDGNPITEDWYFHFREDELIEMQLEHEIAEKFQALVDGKTSSKEGVGLIKMFIQSSVGKRSADGRKFAKNQEILDDFNQTGAYSAFLLELVADPAGAALFINSLMPADMETTVHNLGVQQAKNAKKADVVQLPTSGTSETVVNIEPKDPKDMSREELIQAMRERNRK